MTQPVTPQEMFDLWQKMVNPGAYPLQSLMFPVMDPKELEKKVAELHVVEHWLRANLQMLQLTIQSLEFQKSLLEGGEKAKEAFEGAAPGTGDAPNPAMWAWNLMAQAAAPPAAPAKPAKPVRKKKPASR